MKQEKQLEIIWNKFTNNGQQWWIQHKKLCEEYGEVIEAYYNHKYREELNMEDTYIPLVKECADFEVLHKQLSNNYTVFFDDDGNDYLFLDMTIKVRVIMQEYNITMDTLKPYMKQKIDRTLAIIDIMEMFCIDYEAAKRIITCNDKR